MNLSEKMTKWGQLRSEADALEDEIKAEVMPLGKTQKVGNVTATFSSGRGSYDYESMAMKIEPDQDIIDRNTKPIIDWHKVCEEAGMPKEIKELFYKAGNPYVSVKLSSERVSQS